MNRYVVLCSVIVYDAFDFLLMEESLLVEIQSDTEEKAMAQMAEQLAAIQQEMEGNMTAHISLNCHCFFPMGREVTSDSLTKNWLLTRYPALQSMQNKNVFCKK